MESAGCKGVSSVHECAFEPQLLQIQKGVTVGDGQISQAKKKKGKKSNVESDLSKEFRPEIVVYCRLFLFCKQVCSSRDAMHHAMLFNSETMYFGKAINYNGSTHLALASSQYSVDLKKEYYLCSTSKPSSTA